MTRYRLSGAVMTHPQRQAAAERLARSAPPGALRVVMDPDPAGKPSVLRTALCAWEAIEDGATHQLVVQDDMILSDTFFERARMAIAEMPDAALALFALWDSRNGAAVRFGAMAGARWVGAVNEYFPCVAIILPREVASGFAAFGRRHLDSWPDDILMNRYLRAHGIPSYVSVPSLAEHEDHGSISGNAFRGPRRSVCFLPQDVPGREGARLTGLRVLPFFKQGVAQCAVRTVPADARAPHALRGPDAGRWLHLDCEQYLEGSGVRIGRQQPAIVRMAEATTPEAARGAWLTAFTMGFVHQKDGLRCDPATGDPGDAPGPDAVPDPAVLAEALATVGPGGISYAQAEERIAQQRDELARITRAGLDAGRETAERTRPSRRAHPTPTDAHRADAHRADIQRVAIVGGAGTPLGEHLVRGLTDAGHHVTTLTRRPTGHPPHALLDLTPLALPPTTSPNSTLTLTLELPTPGPKFTLHLGDLYGPGCPHDSRIGRLVWDALRSYPLTLDDPAGTLRPLHTRDLVSALSLLLRTPPPEPVIGLADAPITAAELAEAIRTAVRPVPFVPPEEAARATPETTAWPPSPPGWKPVTELRYGLHTHAQWLAYEGIHLVLEV
ncbi:hypothetical protein [Streptomyces noursei]|uniref:hypothetical protein n=1 Tax=Streptomyces noursei TaxID=1971 RepID=UPI0016750A2E|nr:hypothetical protein [Streptomyces noursei]MCZ1020227.1 hypothetical protein [Streptomyces noursei]GGX52389.1 hypothetical protein GCM10010341_87210 [Streptomyces noursei]